MKKSFSRIPLLYRMIIVGVIVGVILTLLSLLFLIWEMWDWTVGVALGSVIEIVCVTLLYLGSDLSLKDKGYAFFALFFILRMFLYAAGIIVSALLTYYFEIKAINVFGVLIGYAPMQIVVIIASIKERFDLTKSITKIETKIETKEEEKKDA